MESNTMWTDRATKIRLHVPEDSDESIDVVLLVGNAETNQTAMHDPGRQGLLRFKLPLACLKSDGAISIWLLPIRPGECSFFFLVTVNYAVCE